MIGRVRCCMADCFFLNTTGATMKNFLSGLVVLGVFQAALTQAKAQYAYTSFDVPGADFTLANAFNEAGWIVGKYYAGQAWHGFLLQDGSYTTVDPPGSTF